QIGTEPYAAAARRERARKKIRKRRLAAAVGADYADPAAAQNAGGKIHHDRRPAIAFRDALRLDDQPSGAFRFGRRHGDRAGCSPGVPSALAQRLKAGDTAHVALAPGGDAVSHPMLFGFDLAIELVPLALFLGQNVVAPGLERRKSAIDAARLAAVEP